MTNIYADYTVDGWVTADLLQKAQDDWAAGILALGDLVTIINAYTNNTRIPNPATQKALLVGGILAVSAVGFYFLFKK